jgi:predicted DNA repair protein MutK
MPKLLSSSRSSGTAAMLWVGGHILLVGTHDLGWHALYDVVHHLEEAAHDAAGASAVLVGWLVNTFASAVVGLVVGGLIVLVVTLIAKARGTSSSAASAH